MQMYTFTLLDSNLNCRGLHYFRHPFYRQLNLVRIYNNVLRIAFASFVAEDTCFDILLSNALIFRHFKCD